MTVSLKRNRSEVRDLQLKQELRAAVKSSLYRIISTFGEHITAVPMQPEVRQKVENYKAFMEA